MQASQHFLVTGGAGFLGHHLIADLLAAGHQVTCLDNFSTGRMENIAAFAGHPGFTVLNHDVRRSFILTVDAIYNLACPASPAWYQRDPVGTLQTCVLGMINVLELARETGCRVLQASTSEIYGDPQRSPQSEDYNGNVNPLGPRACYDEGKRCAETLCRDYARQYGVDVRIARIFNTYGPGMRPDDGRVIPAFLRSIRRGEPLVVYGSGDQTRAFCHVADLIRGLTGLMQISDPVDDPVNFGMDRAISIRDLADTLAGLLGRPVSLVHRPALKDDPSRRQPDLRRARALLGWEPQIPLEVGLRDLLAEHSA